jgi:HAD superfamily hydrolase (TIGR01459 family)
MANTQIISGLGEIAGDYDALVCDVWGVLHNGVAPFWPAVEALRRFRAERGRVVLLTNAPRPPAGIVAQFANIGVPPDCYDVIVTSGGAAREYLAQRSAEAPLPMLHIGPERDRGLYEGLNVVLTGPEAAALVLCSGLFDDETETPETYRSTFVDLKERRLPMICANPDVMVPRGGKLIWCGGGLAKLYEELGGDVTYYGKPHPPIYALALEAAGNPARALVIGDGFETDIRGANAVGLDALFVAQGLHAKEVGNLTQGNLAGLLGAKGLSARAAVDVLAW